MEIKLKLAIKGGKNFSDSDSFFQTGKEFLYLYYYLFVYGNP